MARRSDPPGTMLDLPSARVHLQVVGEGPTVVYIPDPPNGLDAAAPLVEPLARTHRVVSYELPGFGWSRPGPGFHGRIEDHVRVLSEVLAATDERPVTLIAPCVGGFVACAYAAKHPEAVRALVLPQTPSWAAAQRWADRVDRRRLLRGPLGRPLARLAGGTVAKGWYGVAEPDQPARDDLVRMFGARPRTGRRFAIATALRALEADAPPIPDVAIPTLLLWGDRDRSHPRSHAHTLAPQCGHATCATVTAGHFPDLRRPDVVLDWLEASEPT